MQWTYRIDMRIGGSGANMREHWAVKMRRVRTERAMAKVATIAAIGHRIAAGELDGRVDITMCVHRRRKPDDDNIVGACKAIRDGIADALRTNDGDPRLTWRAEYAVGPKHFVEVTIYAR